MEKIWRYTPQSGFTNKNAGFSMWCFATYEGKEYFVKQFLSPKYPADDRISSPEKIARKIRECSAFEQRHNQLYKTLTDYSDGNDVRIIEFFRVASRYYIVTEKIDALTWEIEDVFALNESEKRRLCAIVTHAVAALHRGHLVHSDIKHDNILYTRLPSGRLTAKIIDFDGGFLESDPPSMEDGVTGDMNYFSPEVCARTYGEERPLTCKLDVFALGVLFHQYFAGKMPDFDRNAASCPGEALLQGAKLEVDGAIPSDVAALIGKMISLDPAERPTSDEVFQALSAGVKPKAEAAAKPRFPEDKAAERFISHAETTYEHPEKSAPPRSPFYSPGDL